MKTMFEFPNIKKLCSNFQIVDNSLMESPLVGPSVCEDRRLLHRSFLANQSFPRASLGSVARHLKARRLESGEGHTSLLEKVVDSISITS